MRSAQRRLRRFRRHSSSPRYSPHVHSLPVQVLFAPYQRDFFATHNFAPRTIAEPLWFQRPLPHRRRIRILRGPGLGSAVPDWSAWQTAWVQSWPYPRWSEGKPRGPGWSACYPRRMSQISNCGLHLFDIFFIGCLPNPAIEPQKNKRTQSAWNGYFIDDIMNLSIAHPSIHQIVQDVAPILHQLSGGTKPFSIDKYPVLFNTQGNSRM